MLADEVVSPTSSRRQGAILAISEIILALRLSNYSFQEKGEVNEERNIENKELVEKIVQIVPKIEKARLYR